MAANRPVARHNGTGRTYMPRSSTNDALEQRVYGVEKGQSALSERIDNLGTGIDGRLDRLTATIERRFSEFAAARTPQWGAFSIIATVSIFVIASFGALAVAFIQGNIGYLDRRIDEQRAGVEMRITRTELDQRLAGITSLSDVVAANGKDRDDRVSTAIMELRRESVSQAEHAALLDRVTKTETAIGAITPAGSVIQDVLDRLKRLEERPYRGNWNAPPPAP